MNEYTEYLKKNEEFRHVLRLSKYLFQLLHSYKKTMVYKCMALLPHVSTYNGHLQEGGYQMEK